MHLPLRGRYGDWHMVQDGDDEPDWIVQVVQCGRVVLHAVHTDSV